jgi:hypothetical protein
VVDFEEDFVVEGGEEEEDGVVEEVAGEVDSEVATSEDAVAI